MSNVSRRLLVAPVTLACIGFALFATVPLLTERLHLATNSPAAVALHHVSGTWTILALAWLGGRCADVLLQRVALVSRDGVAYPRLLIDLLNAVLFVIAGLIILQFVFGQSVTGLVTVSGVVIAVVGFALRNVIGDLASGIALSVDHPYRIGDWIETTQGSAGRVAEITWRTTRLVDRNSFVIIVPNGLIATQRLINYSGGGRDYRTALRVPLDAALPAERAKRILLSGALDAAREIAGLAPDVLLADYMDGAAVYMVRFRVPDFGQETACRDAVASCVLHALHCAGQTIRQPGVAWLAEPARESPPQALLRQVDLFHAFDAAENATLAGKMRPHNLAAGEALMRQGDAGDSLYLLAEGILDVAVDRGPLGVLHDRMAPGAVFGEMSLLTGQPRRATVTAAMDAVVYEIRREDLDPILRHRPALAYGLALVMAEHEARNARLGREPGQAPPPGRDDLLARLRLLFHL
jgi:small-conductance mechanosensitive channel